MGVPRQPDPGYIPALDGLRAVAIIIVIASHFGLSGMVPGEFGVTLFFFISGFLITRLLLAEMRASGKFSIGRFYIRRFLRLGPPLFLVIATVSALSYSERNPIGLMQVAAAVFYLINYFVVLGGACSLPLLVLWSLAVEEHFYLLYPVFLSIAWKWGTKFIVAIFSLCIAVMLWRTFLYFYLHVGRDRIAYSTDTRIDSILFGVGLSSILAIKPDGPIVNRLASMSVLLGSIVILLATFLIRNEGFRETIRYSLQGTALLSIVYCLIFSDRTPLARSILNFPIMNWIGRLSYSLYLWHPTAAYIISISEPSMGAPLKYIAALQVTLLLAAASYYAVELPFGKLRRRLRQDSVLPPNRTLRLNASTTHVPS